MTKQAIAATAATLFTACTIASIAHAAGVRRSGINACKGRNACRGQGRVEAARPPDARARAARFCSPRDYRFRQPQPEVPGQA